MQFFSTCTDYSSLEIFCLLKHLSIFQELCSDINFNHITYTMEVIQGKIRVRWMRIRISTVDVFSVWKTIDKIHTLANEIIIINLIVILSYLRMLKNPNTLILSALKLFLKSVLKVEVCTVHMYAPMFNYLGTICITIFP